MSKYKMLCLYTVWLYLLYRIVPVYPCQQYTPSLYVLQMANGVPSAKRVHLSWRCNSMKPIIAVKRQRVCGLWLAWRVQ